MKKILKKYSKTYYPFHMPGHKQGRWNPMSGYNCYEMDITETTVSDDLYHPESFIKDSLDYARAVYKTEKTYYLVGGSTGGIMMAIDCCTKKGDQVLIQRNAHHAVYNSLINCELDPLYINPAYDTELQLFGGINPLDIDQACQENPDITCVLVTSPSYEGIVLDIETIANVVHDYGKLLIVDEAHGAHLSFYNFTPNSALECGADIVVQSLHKTLPALTQTALLHINSKRVDIDKMDFYYQMYQTSSPSFVLVSSIDSCIKSMAKKSIARQIAYEELLENFRDKVKSLQYVKLLNKNYFTNKELFVYDFDITRLVFIGKDRLINGIGLHEALLHRYNFVFEMACSRYLVGISTIADNSEGFSRLYDALGAIGEIGYKNETDFGIISIGKNTIKKAMKPYEVMDLEWEWIPIHDAENRVVKNYIKIYPPSIPILVPGEIITNEVISCIDQLQGLNIQGLMNGKVAVIKHGG